MSVKLWKCALETGRLNSQGVGRWASVESVSGRREKYSVNKISVQEEEKHPGVWERDWPNSRAWKVIVWTCSFKRLCGSENWDCFFKWGADRTTEMKELSSLRVIQTLEWKKKPNSKWRRVPKVTVERQRLHRDDQQERKAQWLQHNNRGTVKAETA